MPAKQEEGCSETKLLSRNAISRLERNLLVIHHLQPTDEGLSFVLFIDFQDIMSPNFVKF